ncbi:MAG: S9 family peptidase [Salinivirgaceae bacterium]|nr:S9 family peptidase [Salinivirgaceae bacterium]
MNGKLIIPAALLVLIAQGCQNDKITYPMTKKVDTVDVYFGQQVADPYRWLEDDNSDETAQWVAEQNKLTFGYLEKIPFREQVKKRLEQIYNYQKITRPRKWNGHYFWYKKDGLQNQSVMYYSDTLGGKEIELLDPNTLSDDGTVALSTVSVSHDGRYLGYGIARAGSDWNELYVKEIATGKTLDDHIQWVKFSGIAWYKDGFFYTRFPEPTGGDALTGENVNSKIYYHKIGDTQANDKLIYEDPQHPEWMFSVGVSDDETIMLISVAESTSGNALYIKDLKNNGPIKRIVENFDNNYSVVDNCEGKMLVLTDFGAPKYRLVAIDPAKTDSKNWTVVIPEKENVLASVSVKAGKLIAEYVKDAQSHFEVYSLKGEYLHDVELPQIGTAYGFDDDKDDNITFYTMETFTSPSTIYKYDVNTNKSELYLQTDIDFDGSGYVTKQVFYTSKDGSQIPMFIVHKEGIKLDGSHKVWMYGYGGFNITLTPGFGILQSVWLEQGGIYCQMNLRGGGEYGEEWHRAGTLMNKQNVFDDCIAAAEYMIAEGYTKAGNIVLQGGSNGGLLVGAVVNQRPDLYGVSLPAVGVMDMLRYHKFTIGRHWAIDYGTSEDSAEMFQYLLGYSPLHTIANKAYPATLVTTGDHDDRVVPAHSFKFAATLQEHQQGAAPVLIRIETNAGHGAGKPTSKIIEERADQLSFAFYNLKMTPKY